MLDELKSQQREYLEKKPDKEWYFKFIGRPLSPYLNRILLFIFPSISTTQVSLLEVLTWVLAGILFLSGNYLHGILAILLLHLSRILDCCDGELARYKNQCCLKGRWLEEVSHRSFAPFIFLAIGLASYLTTADVNYLLLGFLASFFWLLNNTFALSKQVVFLKQKAESEERISAILTKKSSLFDIPRRIYRFLTSNNQIIILITILFFLNQLHWLVLFYGILLLLTFLTSFLITCLFYSGDLKSSF